MAYIIAAGETEQEARDYCAAEAYPRVGELVATAEHEDYNSYCFVYEGTHREWAGVDDAAIEFVPIASCIQGTFKHIEGVAFVL